MYFWTSRDPCVVCCYVSSLFNAVVLMGKRRCEHDKLMCDWYVLNAKHQASQQWMQNTTQAEDPENSQVSTHKHWSYTLKGPAQVSTQTEYFGTPRGSHMVPPPSALHTSDTFAFDFDTLLDSNEDDVYNQHLAETSLEVKVSQRNWHLGVSEDNLSWIQLLTCCFEG